MTASYPSSIKRFDRIINLVSDIDENNVNLIYDEVESMQETIGTDIQGAKSTLKARLATALDDSGNIRANAVGSAALQDDIITNNKVYNPDTFDFNSINVGRHGVTSVYGYTASAGPETVNSGVTIDASGNVQINGNLTVEGQADLLNLLAGTQTNVVTENMVVSGDLTVGGLTTFTGTQYVTGDLNVNGNVVLGDNLSDTVSISGSVDILGQTTIDDNLVVTGTADISGNTSLDGTLDVSGQTTIDDNLVVTGTADISGNTTLGGSLTDGTATLSSGALTGLTSLTVDNITLNGTDIST